MERREENGNVGKEPVLNTHLTSSSAMAKPGGFTRVYLKTAKQKNNRAI